METEAIRPDGIQPTKETQLNLGKNPPAILQFKDAHQKFERRNPENPELVEAFDQIFRAFNSELLTNSRIFETADGQASFPYTSINITDFTKKIYKPDQTAQTATQNDKQVQSPRDEKYFIVGSHLILKDGQFTYVEIALHEFMKRLPAILKDLENGRVPNEAEIIITGAPTSMYGHTTPKFVQEVQSGPTQTYAKMYEQFVETKLPQNTTNRKRAHITIHGYSMGASWSARIAEIMADKNDPSTPKPLVIMDAPAGLHKKRLWPLTPNRLKAGFGVDALIALATKSDVRHFILNEGKYWESLTPYLVENNGYQVNLDPEQTKLKKQIIAATVGELQEGIPVENDKIRAVVRWGKQDLSMITLPYLRDVIKRNTHLKRSKYKVVRKDEEVEVDPSKSSIVKNQLPTYKPRTFAIKSPHVYPFFRRNELRRWQNTTKIVQDLIRQGKIELPQSIVA